MTSEAQILANRQNALKSTGPRNTSLTRFNALKHGLTAEALTVMPYERPYQYKTIVEALRQDYQSQTATEEILIQQMASSLWRRWRLVRAEKAGIEGNLVANASEFDRQEEEKGQQLQGVIEEEMAKEIQIKYATQKRYRRFRESLSPEKQAALAEITRNPPEVDYIRLERARSDWREMEATRPQRRQTHLKRRLYPYVDALTVRYDSSLERQFYRALVMLLKIQAARRGQIDT